MSVLRVKRYEMAKRDIQELQCDEETAQLCYKRYEAIYHSTQVGGGRISPRQEMLAFPAHATVDFKTIGEAGKIWKIKKIGSRNNFSSSDFSSSSDFNSSSNLSSSDFSSRNNISSNKFSSSSDLNNSSSDLSSNNSALLMTAMQCF